MFVRFIFLFALMLHSVTCVAEDWRQFRGTHNNGIVTGPALPDTLDDIAWKIDLNGRGVSSPIIVGDRIFVTSSQGFHQDRLVVNCYDTNNGSELWQREFWATGRTICHKKWRSRRQLLPPMENGFLRSTLRMM